MSEWVGYPHLQEVVMQRFLFLRVACVLALTVGGGVAHAQSEPPAASATPPPAAGTELAATLSRHGTARLQTRGGWFELTRPLLADDTGLTYRAARRLDSEMPAADLPQPLPLSEISEIQLRANAAGRGAVIGGAVAGGFALLGVLPLAAACDDLGAGEQCGIVSAPVIGTVLVVGAGGAGIGALIGASVKRWKTVYRAP